jgi:hypothetical protein
VKQHRSSVWIQVLATILLATGFPAIGVAQARVRATIVFDGLTAPNRHAIQDISREARDWAPGLDLQFHDVSSGKPIEDPGDALVILSSATVGNVDRALRPTLSVQLGQSAGPEKFVMLLVPETEDTRVTVSSGAEFAPEVDVVTAATRWRENPLGALFNEELRERNRRVEEMHLEWIRTLLDRLQQVR